MRTVIVEARPSDASGNPVDIRLAGGGRSHYLFKGLADWRAGVVSLPRVQAALGFGKDGFTGGAVAQASAVGFAPAMASTRALMAGLIWNDAAITVSIGDDRDGEPAWTVKLSGTIAGYSNSAGRFVFTLSDMAGRLGEPLVKDSFAGTGGIEGDAAAKGRVKRRSWGRCWNVEGRVLLAAWNIYEFGDPARPLGAFDAVKDKGRPVPIATVEWAGSVAATLEALKAATVQEGGCAAAPSIACVKWWTQPSTLTADLRGELGSGYVETVPGIAAAISAAAEGPAVDGLAALVALRPDPAGLHADQASETPAQMLDRLTLRASLSWAVTADRRIALRPIAFADPVETIAFEDVERRSAYAPVATVKVGFQKNHRVHSDGEISAAVLAGDVTFPDGQKLADLQPAQPGADVTGKNTAKDTAAVAGRPAGQVTTAIDANEAAIVTARKEIETARASLSSDIAVARDETAKVRSDLSTAVSDVSASAATARSEAASARQAASTVASDLSSEIERAKGQEGTLLTKTQQAQGRADAAYSATTDEAVNRAAADSAIAGRVTSTEAQLRGDQDSVIAGRIRDEAATRANQDSAIAGRVATTEAGLSQRAPTWMVKSCGNSASLPTGFGDAGIYRPDGSTAAFAGRSYTVAWFDLGGSDIAGHKRFDVFGGGEQKYNGPNTSDNDAAAMARYIESIPGGRSVVVFTTDEPSTNRLTPSLLQAMQSIGAGIRYESPSFSFRAAYVLFGRTGIGRGNGREHYLGNVDNDPAAFLELPFTASGGRIQLGDQSGLTVIQASVTDEATTRANQDSAIAGRVSSTEAQLRGDQDSVIAARIRDEATARANQDSAIAGRVSTVEARASRAGNWVPNTTLATLAGWGLGNNPNGGDWSINGNGDDWRPAGENVIALNEHVVGRDYMEVVSDPIAVEAGSWLQAYARTSNHRCRAWVTLFFYNANGGWAGYAGENFSPNRGNGGRALTGWDYTGVKRCQIPDGVVSVRLALRKYPTDEGGGHSVAWFTQPYVGPASDALNEWTPYSPGTGKASVAETLARITDEATTRANQDGALAGRISSTEAQLRGDQDSVIAARIRDEATARANQDSAIASRVSSTEAQLRGDQDSVIAARIRDEAAARANQDSAIAGRVATTEANYGKLNDSVSGAIFPGFERKSDGWGSDTSWSGRNSGIFWENGSQGAALGFQVPADGNHWLYMDAPDRLIRAVKGRKYRAGFWIVQWQAPNGYGGNPRVYWESFNQDKSVGEFLGYSANAPEATRSYYAAIPDSAFYCYASDIYVDWDQGAYPNRVWLRPRINVDNMPGGSGYQISGWFFREITDDVRTNARVTDEATTRANQDSAIAGRVASTEAQLNGSQDSVIAGRIRDEATTRANQDSAIAGRVSSTEAVVNRTPAQFRVTSRGASASNAPFGETRFVTPDGNTYWTGGRSYLVIVFDPNSNNVGYANTFDVFGNGASGPAQMAALLNGIGTGQTVIIATADEPQSNRFNNGLDDAMGRVGAGEAFFSPSFKYRSSYVLVGRAGAGKGNGVEFYNGVTDNDPNAFIDEYIPMLNGKAVLGSNGGTTQVRAALSDEAAARANADSAISSRVSTTEARAGALEGRVQSSEGAIADVRNKVATAWAEKTVSVPGAAATVRMIATDANGNPTSNVAFLADVIALINTVNGQPIAALKAEGGNVLIANDLRGGKGRVIMDNGSVMKVMGTGFGSSNQFIEWFGPRQDNLANCTESNASYYLKTDGSSYFGGSLSAGTIKNAIGTTSTASNASVTTGTVGSRGGSRVVVLSYSWAWYQRVDKPQSEASGNDLSAQIILSRNGADVATLNATGSWDRDPAHSSDEPGDYREAIGGSLTFTDNSGGSSVEYSARLVTRNTGPGPQNGSNRPGEATQRISIVQTEQ
ncbi:interleukin-like EMT inducer domain-containing protein [Sphingomonas sp. 1185]|uniref:interleukin-like EMT inducer domain-containing protein n=1 Tax=Sphingomonas sp. 1185 TaxID=3156411 RepID=UPI003398F0FD